jgi:hypothetical protein
MDKIWEGISHYQKQIPVPAELDDRIRQRIEKLVTKRKAARKRRMLITLAGSLALTSTAGLAALNIDEITDRSGRFSYKIEQARIVGKEERMQTAMTKADQELAELEKQFSPGTAYLVYQRTDRPDMESHYYKQKSLVISDLSAFQDQLGLFADVPEVLAGGYRFVEGSLDFEIDRARYDEEGYLQMMREEAVTNNRQIAVKQVPLQRDFIRQAQAIYRNQDKQITLWIDDVGSSGAAEVGFSYTSLEKVPLSGFDALYATFTDSSGKEMQVLKWIGSKIPGTNRSRMYQLCAATEDATKADLLKAAEVFLD